jgi:hypothetical protein
MGEVGVAEFSVDLFYGDTTKLNVEAPVKTTFLLCFSYM